MFEKRTYSPLFYLTSALGSAVILFSAILITVVMWSKGIGQDFFTQNLQTSVLFTDGIAASNAAPLFLASFNLYLCRVGIRKYRKFLKNLFKE